MLAIHPSTLTPAQAVTAKDTHGIGLIGDVLSAKCRRRLNGDRSLNVEALASEHNLSLIVADRLICYKGQFYRIQRPGRSTARGRKTIRFEAMHILYDLDRGHGTIVNIETKEDPATPDGIDAGAALAQVLAGSPFNVGVVDIDNQLEYLELLRASRLDGVRQVVEIWGGELDCDNWVINLRAAVGEDRGVILRYGSNIDQVDYQEDISTVVTRLHGYGSDNANFADINGGLDYVDSDDIGAYAYVREDWVEFPDIDDPAQLLQLTREHLAEVEKPQLSLRIKLVNMRGTPHWSQYAEIDRMDVGDTVTVINDDNGVEITARVQELEEDCLTGEITDLQVGNVKADLALRNIAQTQTIAKNAQKEVRMVSAETDRHRQLLNQAAEQIAAAQQAIADAAQQIIDAQVEIAEASQQIDDAKERLEGVEGVVTTQGIDIQALDDELSSKATKTELNSLAGTVTEQGTAITQNAQEIAMKANQSVVDTLAGTVSTQGTAITQSAQQIALKADQSVVDTLAGTVSSQGTAITQNAQQIALKADQSVVDTLAGTVSGMSAELDLVPGAITAAVESIKVGGTNRFSNNSPLTIMDPFTIISRNADDYLNGFYGVGTPGGSGIVRVNGVIDSNGYWTVSFDVRGMQGFVLPITVDVCDLGNTTFYTNASNTYERKTLTVNVTNHSSDLYNFVDFGNLGYAYYRIRNIKVEKGTMATDWSPSPSDTAAAIAEAVSGRTTVWCQSGTPTAKEIGDIWYDTSANPVIIKRWSESGWVDITTYALSKALEAAGTAQATADGKIRTFAQTSAPTGMVASDVGDLWFDTDDDNKPWRWSGSAWVPYQDTHLDSRMQSAEQKITPDAITSTVRNHANYQADLAGKNRTYILSTPPSGANTGDLWIDTANGNMLKRWNGTSWVAVQDGAISLAQQQADKIQWLVASGTSGSNMVLTDYLYSLIANNINLSANNSIKLAVSGGTNYYSKSTAYATYTDAGTLVVNGRDQAGYENGFFITGPQGSSNNYLRLDGVITENGYWTVSFDVRGTQGWVVPVTVDICDLGSTTFYSNATNTYERKSLTVNVTNYSAIYSFVDFGQFGYSYYNIRNIKVEKGTLATDWSPSPLDPVSGVKAAGIEIGPGFMRQYADLDWSMSAGSGANEIGMANKRADGLFVWGGGSPTSAKTRMWMDGSARFDQIMIGNSGVNQFTQMYPYADADNADDLNSMILKVFVPADCSGVQSLKLSFSLEAFRAYSKGAASGGGGTSGVNTAGEAGFQNYTGYAGSGVAHSASSSAQGISVSETADHRHSYAYTITVLSHTHGTPSHTHPITYGIYAGPVANSCQVIVDGVNIGSFASLTAQDITAQLAKVSGKVTRDTWHTIELKPNGLTRIVAQAFLVAVVATATNAIY